MTFALAVLLAALPARAAESSPDEDWSPRVTAVTGEVLVFEPGAEEGVPAEAETPLEDGDRVETAEGATAELALEPESVVELGGKTTFTLGSTKRSGSWFSLELGSFVAKLKSLAADRAGLQVRTPTAVAAVRGTEFGLEVGEDGETAVGVYDEGKVAVTSSEGGPETVLTSRQELVQRRGQRMGKPQALQRLKARRERLMRLRDRRAQLRKTWRRLDQAQRKELRQRWRQNMREKMKNMPPKQRQRLRKRAQKAMPRKGRPHLPHRGGRK